MGFEVYLALDEFSWSKKTQPRLQRRRIMSMSVSDEENIYVFPDDIPINIDVYKRQAQTMATIRYTAVMTIRENMCLSWYMGKR